MKKILLISMICFLITPFIARSQDGLDINKLFSAPFIDNDGVTYLNITGKQLDTYGMSLYRSISVTENPELSTTVEQAVKHDGTSAISREVSFKYGKLYFGFYTLTPIKGINRFILYLNLATEEKPKTTLIYLEGKCDETTIKKLLYNNE